MTEYSVYVGSVFHKDTIAVASRQEPVSPLAVSS